jgi:PAS domain-containing protein
MTLIPDCNQENTTERLHLAALINQLSDDQLSHPMDAGWTVSAVLAHLAFWDIRALVLIEKWQKDGIGPSPMDTDVVNEVTRKFFLAISPRKAAETALESAAAIDQIIEQLSPEMTTAIDTIGKTVHLNRADHRRMHLGEIEKTLGIC